MKKGYTQKEYDQAVALRAGFSKLFNVALTIASALVAFITAILAVMEVVDWIIAGLIIPAAIAVLTLMNVFAMKNEKRKVAMIIYIVALSVSIIVFFLDLVMYKIN